MLPMEVFERDAWGRFRVRDAKRYPEVPLGDGRPKVSKREVASFLGKKSPRSVDRLAEKDPEFPKHFDICGRHYFDPTEIENWLMRRRAVEAHDMERATAFA